MLVLCSVSVILKQLLGVRCRLRERLPFIKEAVKRRPGSLACLPARRATRRCYPYSMPVLPIHGRARAAA